MSEGKTSIPQAKQFRELAAQHGVSPETLFNL